MCLKIHHYFSPSTNECLINRKTTSLLNNFHEYMLYLPFYPIITQYDQFINWFEIELLEVVTSFIQIKVCPFLFVIFFFFILTKDKRPDYLFCSGFVQMRCSTIASLCDGNTSVSSSEITPYPTVKCQLHNYALLQSSV